MASQLGHASPEFTLRVYAHALREEEEDLSFLDFGGTKRHPRGTTSEHPTCSISTNCQVPAVLGTHGKNLVTGSMLK